MLKTARHLLVGLALCANLNSAIAGNVGQVPVNGFAPVDGTWLLGLAGGLNQTYQNGITAHAGGGQTSALALGSGIALLQVDTVATSGDSVALPICVAPASLLLRNNGASSMNVYASPNTNLITGTTDTINGNSNATAYAIGAGSKVAFDCIKNGQWSGGGVNATISGTLTVTGAATLQSTLAVTGATTLSSTLGVTGVTTPTGGIAAAGGFTASPRLVMTGNWKPLAITDGTEVTCVATTTYIAELFVPANMTVTGVSLVNATAVAGNVQVQLADSTGAPIAAAVSASTAASGTGAYQRIPFAVAYAAKGPATYYLMSQCNNTGYKFRAHTVGDFATQSVTSGTYGTFASFTPATTFTTVVGPVASFY